MLPLPPELYQHPLDRESFLNLQGLSWLSKLPKLFVMDDMERDYQLLCLADHVALRQRDHPKLHAALDRAMDALGFQPRPDLFLLCDPAPQSYSFGEREPLIVLSSGLLELLDDDERMVVLAHEIGHLTLRHTFYQMVAQNFAALAQLSGIVPFAGAVSLGARVPLYDWYRKADLSADRAALAACGDPVLIVRTIAKLAGGRLGGVTSEALVDQARLLDRICEKLKTGSLKERATYYFSTIFLQGFLRTAPYPAMRAREILEWAPSPVAQALLRKDTVKAQQLLAAAAHKEASATPASKIWGVGAWWDDFAGLFEGENDKKGGP